MGKCVNANSDPSGVNGTKQGNKGKATSNTTPNLQNWIGGKVEVKTVPVIAMRAL